MDQSNNILIGRRIKSLKPDMDCDEYDQERTIPVASEGVISRLNHVAASGERNYDVFWDNGAWTVYSESEIADNLNFVEC